MAQTLALTEKENDKKLSPKTKLVASQDTESLLIAAKNYSNKMFFHSKLNIHNLTYYNLKTKESLNYPWAEDQAGLDSSVFASIHIDFLTTALLNNPGVTEIIVWQDSCGYQNKNCVQTSADSEFSMKNGVTVTRKYL